jgi:hypothetical protein
MQSLTNRSFRVGLIVVILAFILIGLTVPAQGPAPIQELIPTVVLLKTPTSQGSGFIIHPEGWIMTNAHVVCRSPEEVTVRLTNGSTYGAEVKAIDISQDLALLKIGANNLPTVRFGDSDLVGVGDRVIVIGYPIAEIIGKEPTLTQGIVSAKGRRIPGFPSCETITLEDLIQTDAAANPGNSGGPMFNPQGEVLGVVNGGIRGVIEGVPIEGIAFAIPINKVREQLQRWEEEGKVPPEIREHADRPVLLFSDDFSNPASGWAVHPLLGISIWGNDELDYEDGEYHLLVTRSWSYLASTVINLDFQSLWGFLWIWMGRSRDLTGIASGVTFRDNFRIKVKGRQVSGPIGEYGILFRLGEWDNNFYWFGIMSDGHYRLSKKVNFRWSDIVSWTETPAINKGTEWNLLEVAAKGSEISLYVNGEHLTTVRDHSLVKGYMALFAATFDEPNVHVHFDDFQIWSK